MNRSFQETAELVIFGLIALLVGLAVLWVTGWLINLLGSLFMIIAAFIWTLLRFILPVIVIAAVIYLIVRYAAKGERQPTSAGSATVTAPPAPASRPLATGTGTGAETRTVDAAPPPAPVDAPAAPGEAGSGEVKRPEDR